MNELKSCEYDPKEFRKFLEEQMHIKPGSAYSYVSYVNKASQLLGKEIRKLAQDDASLEGAIDRIALLGGSRNWKYGLIALYRYYHDGKCPRLATANERIVIEDELQSIVRIDGKYIKDLDTKIFRYMPLERYYNLIEDGYNTLTHISHWEDPYEGFIYRGGLDGADVSTQDRIYNIYKSVYGQSWTIMKGESDVLWRAMANGERGDLVRVQTTVRKLAKSILNAVGDKSSKWSPAGTMKIGRIEYKGETEFCEMLSAENLETLIDNAAVDRQLDFLFFKRLEFEAEKEVRLAVFADRSCIDRSKCKRGDLLKFDVDPSELVESVLADPCMDRRKYEQLICRTKFALSDEVGIDLIRKSQLFNWPVVR